MKLSSEPKITEGRERGDQHVRLTQRMGTILALALATQVGAGTVGFAGVQGTHVQQSAQSRLLASLDNIFDQLDMDPAKGRIAVLVEDSHEIDCSVAASHGLRQAVGIKVVDGPDLIAGRYAEVAMTLGVTGQHASGNSSPSEMADDMPTYETGATDDTDALNLHAFSFPETGARGNIVFLCNRAQQFRWNG